MTDGETGAIPGLGSETRDRPCFVLTSTNLQLVVVVQPFQPQVNRARTQFLFNPQ